MTELGKRNAPAPHKPEDILDTDPCGRCGQGFTILDWYHRHHDGLTELHAECCPGCNGDGFVLGWTQDFCEDWPGDDDL